MRARDRRAVAVLLAGIAAAASLVGLGRLTAPTAAAHDRGYQAGQTAGYAKGLNDGRVAGLQEGRMYGVREGRALQVGQSLPAGASGAFDAGYLAGGNDAFSGYDGGWYLDAPYVITLTKGGGGLTYRISSRTLLAAQTNYYLCPGTPVMCHESRR